MGSPLRLNLSGNLPVRVPGITWQRDGALVDPRETVYVGFQMVPADGTTEEAAWVMGSWESTAPPGGPYAATTTIGVGQNDPLNPGQLGTYVLQMLLNSTDPDQYVVLDVGLVKIVGT